ncbi:hypothetical protein [Parashewanella tropica]|uniref:hypothetical protein n=1 Tax=Parashewanella tropica TaxID=2547970 RepID=UPI00105925AA|nr:hypothetical protein [Parashewanella tropica]
MLGRFSLILVAVIAFSVAIAHASCIFFDEQCYSMQMAPEQIIESAKAGTLLAPISAIIAGGIFAVIGLYILSAAGIVRRLPLLKPVVMTIAVVCIIRGLLPIQLWIRKPELVSEGILFIGLVWLFCGLLIYFGQRQALKYEAE